PRDLDSLRRRVRGEEIPRPRRDLEDVRLTTEPPRAADELRTLQQLLLRLLAESRELGDPAGHRRGLQVVERGDPEFLVKGAEPLDAEPRERQQLDQPWRRLAP